MKERLQKIISASGITSRRKAEEWIAAGKVSCNGMVCGLGDRADPETDDIRIDGEPISVTEEKIYLLLHKPRGYVTTLSDEKGRRNAAQLVADCGKRVYPVGRLDMDSEGLLLFTNDGDFANRLMHPSHEVEKTYRVVVNGLTELALEKLKRSVTLDGYTIKPPKVVCIKQALRNAEILVTIHEGRNRQVRRMCAMAGLEVSRLIRISEGALSLGELPCGKWRYLTKDELQKLAD